MDQEAVERFARVVAVYYDEKLGLPPTATEMEVGFLTVVVGLSIHEIAVRRGVAPQTVTAQRVKFRARLGFSEPDARHVHPIWRRLARDYWIAVGREQGAQQQ